MIIMIEKTLLPFSFCKSKSLLNTEITSTFMFNHVLRSIQGVLKSRTNIVNHGFLESRLIKKNVG